MYRAFSRSFSALFLLFISFCCWAQTGANPALYQASKGELNLMIVGSIHAGKENFYPLASPILEAVAQADVLYRELTPEQMTPAKIASAMQKYGYLSTPVPLKQRMSEQHYQQLLVILEKYKLAPHQLMFLQNWSIVIQLTAATIQEFGLNKEQGVDDYFSQLASRAGKKVMGLETLEEQISAMALMEQIEPNTLYGNFFRELKQAKAWLVEVEQAWRSGDAATLKKLYREYDERQQQPELMQALLDKRNINWHQKLIALPADQTYLIVVGDMHLHGQHNILQLLQNSGFEIKRLNSRSRINAHE